MNFFDTNVLIAAKITTHPHHEASSRRLERLAANGNGCCAAHSLSETYNTLTNFSRYGMPASQALEIVEQIRAQFTLIEVNSKDMFATMRLAAEQGVTGPLIYDALLLGCARKVGARQIYTYNVKHFVRIAPDLASRVTTP